MAGLLAAAGAAYLVVVALAWFFQERLVYFPDAGRDVSITPRAAGLDYEDVRITTEDGERLAAWWIPAQMPRGAVLLFHGNAGSIASRIPYAAMFHRLGYATLLVDYRGYGASTGAPSEEGTYRDAAAAWRHLREARGLPAAHIVVAGESLGGGVATWLATHERPAALILASTFTSLPDLGAEVYRFLPVRLISRVRYGNLARMPAIACPVLIAHSPDDEIIPFHHGEALYAAARGPKAFVRMAGAHNDGFLYARPEWSRAVAAFLR